ncbi:uncharacterized protein LOC108049168 isoform X2 [Drosophila rhopaloa]|nr:uncharacterized protein LOC108049168 isoform X2 [Drosophila rhopaloa]
MLMVTIKFVQEIVDSVPNEHRGPGTAALESYINHGRELIERGTSDEKYNYFYNLLNIINTVKGNIDPSTHESQVIGLTSLGLLNVSRDFVREGEKFHNKFLQGASQMKAKLTPTTIARESDLFNVINECINSDFHHREDLIQQFLSFKNRY